MSTFHKVSSTGRGILLAVALAACAAEGPVDSGRDEPAPAPVSAAGLQIEQAQRQLDRGGDAALAVASLQQALRDPAIQPGERRAAVLALSRAHEAAGESEQAIAIIEQELATHADDETWVHGPFTRRLRQLLTGAADQTGPRPEQRSPVPPFAHVVASYFPQEADGSVKASFYMSGGNRELSDELGTFNIRGALEAEREAEWRLWDTGIDVSQSTRQSDWLVIPRMQDHFAGAFLVFYFDLERNRIPARYEKHLPMKVAEIEALLAEGKSFAVAAERPGSPPALLLAAPRTAMLDDVERDLALLKELPLEPKHFEVHPKLRPNEIRSVVRGSWFPTVRQCYEQLLERDASAGGKMVMHFKIMGDDGSIEELRVDAESDSLADEAFYKCVVDSAAAMRFPATGKRFTTVSYPVQFTPNEDR